LPARRSASRAGDRRAAYTTWSSGETHTGQATIARKATGNSARAQYSRPAPGVQRAIGESGGLFEPIYNVRTMEELILRSIGRQCFPMFLLVAFALLALLLALVGIYGVISYSTIRRVNEISIRMALGATKQDVLWMIVGQGTGLAVAGVAIGSVAALVGLLKREESRRVTRKRASTSPVFSWRISSRHCRTFPDGLDTDSNCTDFLLQPATTSSGASAAGATNIKVASGAGFSAGQTITIDSGANLETAVVASTTGGGRGAATITVTAPLTLAHRSPAPALPSRCARRRDGSEAPKSSENLTAEQH
jgi:hypothetical protein